MNINDAGTVGSLAVLSYLALAEMFDKTRFSSRGISHPENLLKTSVNQCFTIETHGRVSLSSDIPKFMYILTYRGLYTRK